MAAESSGRRAQSGTHGHLAVPSPAAREEQTRQVGAGNEQHERSGGLQDEVTLAGIFDAAVEQRFRGDDVASLEVWFLFREFFFELLRNDGEFGLKSLQPSSFPQCSQHVEGKKSGVLFNFG